MGVFQTKENLMKLVLEFLQNITQSKEELYPVQYLLSPRLRQIYITRADYGLSDTVRHYTKIVLPN